MGRDGAGTAVQTWCRGFLVHPLCFPLESSTSCQLLLLPRAHLNRMSGSPVPRTTPTLGSPVLCAFKHLYGLRADGIN